MKTFFTRSFVFVVFLLFSLVELYSKSDVIYTYDDSLKVENLLKGFSESHYASANPIIYFAVRLCGTPYVGATLETGDRECLVVNTRQMDCTTFVENVMALSMASLSDSPSFSVFCKCLRKLRYYGGITDGYPSRKHYFTEWVCDNEKQNLVKMITDENLSDDYPFIKQRKVNVNYMSANYSKYKRLKDNKDMVAAIKDNEMKINGKDMYYVPSSSLDKDSSALEFIKDGDILAIVTSKKGLDISHVGFAVWKDDKLHLLNASGVYKKVHLDKTTLFDYMKANRSGLGVMVVRPQFNS